MAAESGIAVFFADMIDIFPMSEELMCPPRVEQDLTAIRLLVRNIPLIRQRLQSYINLGVPKEEYDSIPNQAALDAFPRQRFISLYMQHYSEIAAKNWLDRMLRYYPDKVVLRELVIQQRNQGRPDKEILMLVLERPDLTNNEISIVGW